jgi:hypothetical protein
MAMERSLQEILERLLAGQQEIREMRADIIAKIEAGQKDDVVSRRNGRYENESSSRGNRGCNGAAGAL